MPPPNSPVLVGSVLFGCDSQVRELVESLIPGESFGNSVALGVVRGGKIVGGVVYYNNRQHDVMANFAFTTPRWCTRQALRTLFGYPFVQLKCARITVMVRKSNKRSRRVVEGLGFKLEGVHPKCADGKETAISYGMLREDCKWIK